MMKAQQINPLFQVAEIKVSYQPKFKACERPKVIRSKDAYDILIRNWDKARINLCEQMYMMLLNRANHVIGIREISSGGFASTVVDPKLIFSIALKGCAAGLIIAHNHPSGNLVPSQEDLNITKRLVEAGRLLDLQVLDHLVVSNDGFYSFGDEGLM